MATRCRGYHSPRILDIVPPEAEPQDVVGPRITDHYIWYAERAAAGGCDLMSRRPICSRFGQIFAVKILDIVC